MQTRRKRGDKDEKKEENGKRGSGSGRSRRREERWGAEDDPHILLAIQVWCPWRTEKLSSLIQQLFWNISLWFLLIVLKFLHTWILLSPKFRYHSAGCAHVRGAIRGCVWNKLFDQALVLGIYHNSEISIGLRIPNTIVSSHCDFPATALCTWFSLTQPS